MDDLKAKLEAELEKYSKSIEKDKDAQAKRAQKQRELTAQFQGEYARVTNLVTGALRKIINQWLKTNKKGVTVVVPSNGTLAFSPKADISGEILKKLNAVKINFEKK